MDKFASSGLMSREYDRVKLHVTLMNTLMRKDPSGGVAPPPRNPDGRRPPRDRESFDASGVLKVHAHARCLPQEQERNTSETIPQIKSFVCEFGDLEQPVKLGEFIVTFLLQKFGDFDFGVYRIEEIHLSQRYSSACDGYYAHAAKIPLP